MDRLLSILSDGSVTSAWFQGTLIILSTFVLEDPTTIGCGLLVAEDAISFHTAFLALWIGIALGDMGLYGMGRFLGPQTIRWGLLNEARLTQAQGCFDRNLLLAVVLSRFVPGMRIPTYVGAGIFRASPLRFLAFTIGATLVWTLLLLGAAVLFGERVLPLLGQFRWPAAGLLLIGIVLIQRLARKKLATDAPATETIQSPVSFFEFWPPVLFYFPVGLWYAWLALRFRSFTLPTAANPRIYAGGLIFESKNDILDQVPTSHQEYFAAHARFQHVEEDDVDGAEAAMDQAGVRYPIVAKPDKGQRGNGVQPVNTREELATYLGAFPRQQEVQLQQRVPFENEAGILYYRLPDETHGHIFSVTRKLFPKVTGDDKQTLAELIDADPRARLLKHVYFPRHAEGLDKVIPADKKVALVFAGSHAGGAIFKDGKNLLSPALEARIDDIARALPEFYFGRFDIRFRDEMSFMDGENFQIVEVNGAGSEATHIWDADARLREAYKTLFAQFTILFRIGAQNRRRGHQALGPFRLLRDCLAYRRLSRDYPMTR
jgi:membrane protein DedA with SNARE-associated domain